MSHFGRADDHQWSQQHLSHYIEGDLGRRARRRLGRHARDCADCGRGILAMRALVHMIQGLDGLEGVRAPAGIFDRIRAGGAGGERGGGPSAPPKNA
ncbi:MAG TPA: zf-HC2 domain-containing protein [Streptosporangiaceae bacterium]|nr:zf-HC2 domain-containing protein [Streptosporangiaceae bacterium]